MEPIISIIIPVYNAASTIVDCVESVFSQDFEDWELLLVDDGSVDESLLLCRELAQRDGRVSVMEQSHQGVAAARNKGLEWAHGTHICFIDGDDVIEVNHLNELYSQKEYDMVICGYSVDEYDVDGILIGQTKHLPVDICLKNLKSNRKCLKELFIVGMIHINCNKLLKTEIIRRYDLCYKGIPVNEDYMFMLQYLMHADSLCTIRTSTYHWNRIINRRTGVSSLPDNLLNIYTDAHSLTRVFFDDEEIAATIMYNTYYLVALRYLAAIETGLLSIAEGWGKLHNLMDDKMVLLSFNSRKNVAHGEWIMNVLLKNHMFSLFYVLNKMLGVIKNVRKFNGWL